MTKRDVLPLMALLLGTGCPGPSDMSMEGSAVVPEAAISAAAPGKRYALFTSYQRDGWDEPRLTDSATVLCSAAIPKEIPFWAGMYGECGAPGLLQVELREVEVTKDDPCLSMVMGLRPELKPLSGLRPTGSPLASATRRVFGSFAPKCDDYGDDRRDDVGTVALAR